MLGPVTQWNSVTSRKTCIFSNIAVRTSNLAAISVFDSVMGVLRLKTNIMHWWKHVTCEGNSSQNYKDVLHVSWQLYIRIGDKLTLLDVFEMLAYRLLTSSNTLQIVEHRSSCFNYHKYCCQESWLLKCC